MPVISGPAKSTGSAGSGAPGILWKGYGRFVQTTQIRFRREFTRIVTGGSEGWPGFV